jgi:3-phenylpropionate/cinnamic acid dioxygenase small subunit
MSVTATELRAIAEAIARLAALADHGSIGDYLKLLADDATWTIATGAVPEVRNRQAIETAARRRRASGSADSGGRPRHVVVTVDAQRVDVGLVAALSFFMLLRIDGAKSVLLSCGRYEDLWRHEGDGWRIANRIVTRGGL